MIPTLETYNNIVDFIKEKFNINFNGYFSIYKNNIQIIKETKGNLIKISEIEQFKEILKLEIEENERINLLESIKKIKEKCYKPTKEKCISCESSNKNICLLKLFTIYENYRPGPHHGHEFGDVNFKVNYKGEECEFVGIAKSYCNLTLSSDSGREMIQQIISTTRDDKRVDIIGAICPAKFDTQLEKDIEYIAKCTQSKIVILDDNFMISLFKQYQKNNEITG